MIRRIHVEKRQAFRDEEKHLFHDFKTLLSLKELNGVRILHRYDVEGVSDELWETAQTTVFAEPPVDKLYGEEGFDSGEVWFAVEYLPGQFDQRADSAEQCLRLLGAENPVVRSATLYGLKGKLDEESVNKIKSYVINAVDSRESSLSKPDTLQPEIKKPGKVQSIESFISADTEALEKIHADLGLAMSVEDLEFCQDYFKNEESRNPTLTEIKLLDTYWSDHCRHTTFLTELTDVTIESSPLTEPVKKSWQDYEEARQTVFGKNPEGRPVCLMDLALIGMRLMRKTGKLDDLEDSPEVNAASIIVNVDIDGKDEEWLLMFKNETHNHPTEIEPFGGAATCLGGAIRDPLSGRSYVYQAMRVTGAGDPRVPIEETLAGKLPQRKITVSAAHGYSSYGNQIGLATGLVREIYHPGYIAKRMEIGAVIAAAPRRLVKRLEPAPGDSIVLVGGRTGRDGVGGATGSSKEHTEQALENSAEVQKGDPPMERKLQRLFRNPEVSKLIKRCNDFGAGGVSVAVGELADSLEIDLDQVSLKYAGLDGTEIALSESQERMAVVLDKKDVESFLNYSTEENLEAKEVAQVVDTGRLRMHWKGDTIVDISRQFLDTNGVRQTSQAKVLSPKPDVRPFESETSGDLKSTWVETLKDLNVCSQKGLIERFDSTIGASAVIHPFGGQFKATPAEAMVSKLPLLEGETKTVSMMSYGFQPELSSWSPYHGAVYAVLESVSRIVASGGKQESIRLTFQEYFEKLRNDPERWGKPLAALLGAWTAQKELGIAAIGGKDSMSGSFGEMDVPPTLVSFAVCPGKLDQVISPEFKKPGSQVIRVDLPRTDSLVPDWESVRNIYSEIHQAILEGKILAASVISDGGAAAAISRMAFGNQLGVKLSEKVDWQSLFEKSYGSFVLEVEAGFSPGFDFELLGQVDSEPVIEWADTQLDLKVLQSVWESPLESVFPTQADAETDPVLVDLFEPHLVPKGKHGIARPRVLIPVFPGTNCEYDSARAFREAGADPEIFIFRNRSETEIRESIQALVKALEHSQILMLAGGFSAGDEPAGSGKFIASIFRQDEVAAATMNLLNDRDGLVLGICNGFQALIKLGLLPYGQIRPLNKSCPTLTYNKIGRHVSCYARTRVISKISPWLSECPLGGEYEIPMSHGEGRFFAEKAVLEKLIEGDQIATQYVDRLGRPSMEIESNPNGSIAAVEGITSPCGKVFGKMGHSERAGKGIALNITGEKIQPIFRSGVAYFA